MLSRRPEPPVYLPSKNKNSDEKFTLPDGYSSAWNYNLRDLYLLKSQSLYIPDKEGWHDRESCWVGENKRNNKIVVIGCSIEKPSNTQLKKFTNYTRTIIRSLGKSIDNVEFHWGFKVGISDFTWSEQGISFRCESENTLLNNLVDFQDYFYDITNRVEKQCLPESHLKLMDVYVESMCSTDKNSKRDIGIEYYLNKWLKDKNYKQIALLGEYGQGKSTCALMFTYNLLSGASSCLEENRIPILIELRGKAPSTMSPDELLAAWAVNYRINPMALKKLLIAGKLVLIFDGFDEMAFISQGETRVAHFRTIWQLAYPENKIVITGRPNFFLDESEMKTALGIRESVPERPHCEAIYLQPFSNSKIQQALRPFKSATQTEICDFAKGNSKFRDLASRPCLLYIIGLLWERPNMAKLRDNLNSASIIDLFVKHSLERQEAKNLKGNRFMVLHTIERSFFMQGIASYMSVNNMPNQISNSDLRACISMLLDVIPETILKDVDAMSAQSLKPLKSRIGEDEVMLENLQTDIRTYGLLVNDLSKNGTMRFAHKSFMEFLVAKVLANSMVRPRVEDAIAISNSQELYVGKVARQRESFSFFAELLGESYPKGISDEEGIVHYILKIIIRSKLIYAIVRSSSRLTFKFKASIIMSMSRRIKSKLRKLDVDSENYKDYKEFLDAVDETFITKTRPHRIFSLLGIFSILLFFPIFEISNRSIRVWETCCYELGLSSRAMAKFIGPYCDKSYFDFSRRQYFEGFSIINLNDTPVDMLMKSIGIVYLIDRRVRMSFESESTKLGE